MQVLKIQIYLSKDNGQILFAQKPNGNVFSVMKKEFLSKNPILQNTNEDKSVSLFMTVGNSLVELIKRDLVVQDLVSLLSPGFTSDGDVIIPNFIDQNDIDQLQEFNSALVQSGEKPIVNEEIFEIFEQSKNFQASQQSENDSAQEDTSEEDESEDDWVDMHEDILDSLTDEEKARLEADHENDLDDSDDSDDSDEEDQ